VWWCDTRCTSPRITSSEACGAYDGERNYGGYDREDGKIYVPIVNGDYGGHL